MLKYIVDENLPYYFSIWKNEAFIHVFDIGKCLTDDEIWEYARTKGLTIISKDSDFSNRVLFHTPPPKVIHLKIGNIRLKGLYEFLQKNWKEIAQVSDSHRLTNIYSDRIEGIE